MIKLKPRLLEIASILLPPSAETMPLAVCDIGTDHGYIPIYLVQNGVEKAIAADISKDSANKALHNIKAFELEDKIGVRVGNGLEILKDNEADTVIIAGMGGILITKILDAGMPKGIKRFIFQPMRDAYELRKWLAQNGFRITKESLVVESKRIYNIILAEYGNEENQDDFELYFGAKLIENNHHYLLVYAKSLFHLIDKKISGVSSSEQAMDPKLLAYKERLERIIEIGGNKL